MVFSRAVNRSRIGPNRTGPAWTKDRIQAEAWTEDRIGPDRENLGPDRSKTGPGRKKEGRKMAEMKMKEANFLYQIP